MTVGGTLILLYFVVREEAREAPVQWVRYAAVLQLVVGMWVVFMGWSRFRVESSNPLTPPLVLPAMSSRNSFVQRPTPRPAFGLRFPGVDVVAAVRQVLLFVGVATVIALLVDPYWALLVGVVALAYQLAGVGLALLSVARRVVVADGRISWTTLRNRRSAPLASLLRVRRADIASPVAVFEFDGHAPLEVLVAWGFPDFLDALTVTAPWLEVNSDVVEMFCSVEGDARGFVDEHTDPEAWRELNGPAETG